MQLFAKDFATYFREFFGLFFLLCFSFVKFRRLAERACCSELVSLHVIAKSLVGVNSKDRFVGVNSKDRFLGRSPYLVIQGLVIFRDTLDGVQDLIIWPR